MLLLSAALPTLAAQAPKKPAEFQGPATMCNGRYALCIKARCEKTVDAQHVDCACVIEDGWNMGPNSCEDRTKSLTSTYSNLFNEGSRVLSCPRTINWAWCYGAACQKSAKDGKLAVCRCPVKNSLAVILVSEDKCKEPGKVCSEMWSAAYPKESAFANHYYAWWMHEHGFHTLPPADPCVTAKK